MGVNFSKKDSRVWVPKRVPSFGWTSQSLPQKPAGDADVPPVLLLLWQGFGIAQKPTHVAVQARLSPAIPCGRLRARSVGVPRRFQQCSRGGRIECGVALRGQPEAARRDMISRVFSDECP